ncbi:MAG: MjaI family restriction endonuclease [Candidatus Aenigmatarchaeota archaeon]
MSKEWILNIANSRWGLTKKTKVGPVAAWIRECSPKTVSEWEEFYLKKLEEFLKNKGIILRPEEYLQTLGKTLYTKISEVMRVEISEINENDCINYIRNLVINRTYEGYLTEKETVYEQLKEILGVEIIAAPDEIDRVYNVDFLIRIGNKLIGLQIKPTTFEHAPEYYTKWKKVYENAHEKFRRKFGGKVFIILSVKKDNKKIIYNRNIIDEIKKEIEKLGSQAKLSQK